MRPHYNSLSKFTITTEYPSGQMVGAFQPYWWKSFTCASSVKGDRKTPNPWAYSSRSVQNLEGSVVYTFNGVLYRETVGVLATTTLQWSKPYDPVFWDTQAYNETLDKLNERVRGSLDLATSLAEAGQTYKMLALTTRYVNAATHIRRSYQRELMKQIRRIRNRKRLDRSLKNWERGIKHRFPEYVPRTRVERRGIVSRVSQLGANGWLEFTYGLNPLLSDISGLANQVVRHTRNGMVVKAKVKLKTDDTLHLYIQNAMGYTGLAPSTHTGIAWCEIGVKLLPGWDKSLSQWTSLNPVSVAYELMPLSFVIDWFLDIGSYLRNLETSIAYSSDFEIGYVSSLQRYERRLVPLQDRAEVPPDSGNSYYISGNTPGVPGATAVEQVCSFNRAILYSYPAPRLPQFSVKLGWRRLLSAASLLRGLIKH